VKYRHQILMPLLLNIPT